MHCFKRVIFFAVLLAFSSCTPQDDRKAQEFDDDDAAFEVVEEPRGGFWRKTSRSSATEAASETESAAAKLSSLGYLGGYQGAPGQSGVVHIDIKKMAPGHTLITSGHEPIAILLSPEGKQVHAWSGSFEQYFPDLSPKDGNLTRGMQYWRFATMLPNGDLLATFEGEALVKLDKNSRLIWGKANRAHHDLELQPDGSILTLARTARKHNGATLVVDQLVFLDKDGNEKQSISILDAVLDSPFRQQVLGDKKLKGDVLHSNSVQTLQGPKLPPGVSPGDVLVSMRNAKALVIVNPKTKKAVWAHKERYYRQHFARVLNDSRLMLFDNTGNKEYSRVLYYRWPDMAFLESVESLPDGRRFQTIALGLARHLSNDNLLIVESYGGRLLELTPAHELVWEYLSPFRAGKNGELVAVLAHAERYSPEQVQKALGQL